MTLFQFLAWTSLLIPASYVAAKVISAACQIGLAMLLMAEDE